jgi:hypothetical protein
MAGIKATDGKGRQGDRRNGDAEKRRSRRGEWMRRRDLLGKSERISSPPAPGERARTVIRDSHAKERGRKAEFKFHSCLH